MSLWTAAELAEALNVKTLPVHGEINGVSIDTRSLQKGDLFIALQGPNFDGNAFIDEALKKGAAAVITSRAHEKGIVVDDTQAALEALARHRRHHTSAAILGITGSAGKTSATQALAHMLRAFGPVHASERSFNNHIGLPLTMARLPRNVDFYVQELGMSHAGELTERTIFLRPNAAMITTIAPAHLENFERIEDIARAKGEIFTGVSAEGLAVIPLDSPYFSILREAAEGRKVRTFGTRDGANAYITGDTIQISGQSYEIPVQLQSGHWMQNLAGLMLLIADMGLSLDTATASLKSFQLLPGRGEVSKIKIPSGTATLIDESYNANPASMQAAFSTLSKYKKGRKILALGDMKELGPQSAQLHTELVFGIPEDVALVITLGEMMHHLHTALPPRFEAIHTESIGQLEGVLKERLKAHDTVLIKGSNSMGLKKIVDSLKSLPQTSKKVTG